MENEFQELNSEHTLDQLKKLEEYLSAQSIVLEELPAYGDEVNDTEEDE